MIKDQKTKIVCTIGPSSEEKKILKKMILAGMDVARLNFSHGNYEEFSKIIKNIRQLSKELNHPIAVLQDLAGPKFRIGKIKNEPLILKRGQTIILSKKESTNSISVNEPKLINALKIKDIIFIDDGTKKLKVIKKYKNKLKAKVLIGGKLFSHKGINVPNLDIKISAITKKDLKDIKFGISKNVDYIALSFVRSEKDIRKLKKLIKGKNIKIIAKIETAQALKNLDKIIKESNGIMVARGDLGIEIPISRLPNIQRLIIKKSNSYGKPVIVATQMLKSMVNNPFPTRAEVTDISNAILEGADAVMLSEETSIGKYPLEAIKIMNSVAKETEKKLKEREIKLKIQNKKYLSIALGVKEISAKIKPKIIIVFTESGKSAQVISSIKISKPILALTPHLKTYNQLSLLYGISSFKIPHLKSLNQIKKTAQKIISSLKLAKKNDKFIIVAGIPFNKKGSANLIFIGKMK